MLILMKRFMSYETFTNCIKIKCIFLKALFKTCRYRYTICTKEIHMTKLILQTIFLCCHKILITITSSVFTRL